MDDLLSDFLSETADHIDGIGSYLVLFEKNPGDADAVTQIFRLVHTLKGTSGFLGLDRLQSIAHAAETLIDTLRDGAPPTATAVSLLLQAFDRIKDLLSQIADAGEEPAGDDSDIVSQIEAYLNGDEAAGASEPEPAAEPEEPSPAVEASEDIEDVEAVAEPEPLEEAVLRPIAEALASARPDAGTGAGKEPERSGIIPPQPQAAEPEQPSATPLAAAATEPERVEPAPAPLEVAKPEPQAPPAAAAAVKAPERIEPVPPQPAAAKPEPSVAPPVAPASVKEPEPAAKAAPAAPKAAPAAAKPAKAKAEAPAKEPEPAASREKAPDTIRIAVATIERIMDLVSELVLTRNQIMDLSRQHNISQIKSPLERLSTVTSDLQDAVMRARMQPVTRLFASVPRLVRELSVDLKKKINLIIEGGDTELDRQLIEAIRDPLTHLIRNCADHGIETPAERVAAGKPEMGEIAISAFYESGQVHIEIADDGRGLNSERIRQKAVERGLRDAASIAAMSDEEVYRFILEPGFSTAAAITTVSGRGVGMDVVRANLEAIGGAILLQSTKGKGSKFILKIPLTLAIAPALIVRVDNQRFAVPQQYVVEAVNVDEEACNLKSMEDALLLQLRDELIPVVELSSVLRLPGSGKLENKLVVVLGLRGQKLGVIVDEIDDIQEIVVKPLGALFSSLKIFSGNTILGDGSVILIVDPAGVAEAMHLEKTAGVVPAQDAQDAHAATSSLILFKAGPGAAKVIPRSAVSRIVRASRKDLDRADGIYLYRYQTKLIPVVPAGGASLEGDSTLILVLSLYGRVFGLAVESVLDIVESQAEIQLVSDAPSLLGTADLGGDAVEFIDAGHYYRLAFQASSRSADQGKANVLVVDGEPGAHDMLTPILASAGHKVTAAETAEQANRLLKLQTFGVILLDSKSAAGIEEAALARQGNALCLIFDDATQSAGHGDEEERLRKFDRGRLLKMIARHLEKSQRDKARAGAAQTGLSQHNARFA
jgi:two-component system, chemotaxis family, sensor kinase CheA